jgi:predicted RNA binding protein YcfA (HicA-like mRNA interferase family)
MAGIEKIIEKMHTQPNGISYDEGAQVLDKHGYKFVRQKGSHCHFRNGHGDLITIVKETPSIKKCYVTDILSRIGK